MTGQIGTSNMVTYSGTSGAAEYNAFWTAAGKPPKVLVSAKEEGFLYQGFYVRCLPQL